MPLLPRIASNPCPKSDTIAHAPLYASKFLQNSEFNMAIHVYNTSHAIFKFLEAGKTFATQPGSHYHSLSMVTFHSEIASFVEYAPHFNPTLTLTASSKTRMT